ncbi:hypothetical protein F511_45652 [Dorcoceras hygrometricum]|uniref:Uncharacterized protein n=1 Tax=Dorcoceras hygrometricum TaxID=472368 RepID=A0A2Z7A2L3_9LAMI|nr:hypothetical protein F511_45652 [Dorcoceras hygrometricum]
MAVIVLIRSENLGSDTTVGKPRWIRITPPDEAAEEQKFAGRRSIQFDTNMQAMTFIGCLDCYLAGNSCLAPTSFWRKPALHGRWRLGDGFGSGPTGPGPTDEHSVHLHHRDFIVTPIADQIGRIDSVSKTEYYDLKNHFSEPQCKITVLPFNIGKFRFDPS